MERGDAWGLCLFSHHSELNIPGCEHMCGSAAKHLTICVHCPWVRTPMSPCIFFPYVYPSRALGQATSGWSPEGRQANAHSLFTSLPAMTDPACACTGLLMAGVTDRVVAELSFGAQRLPSQETISGSLTVLGVLCLIRPRALHGRISGLFCSCEPQITSVAEPVPEHEDFRLSCGSKPLTVSGEERRIVFYYREGWK